MSRSRSISLFITIWTIAVALLAILQVAGPGVGPLQARPPEPVDLSAPDPTSPSSPYAPLSANTGADSVRIYFENFEHGPGGWQTYNTSSQTQDIYWSVNDGLWWCGTDTPCYASPPGYGNSWDQRLEKPFLDVPAGAMLTLAHAYDTEGGYDVCRIKVSADNGVTYDELAAFSGSSGGYISSQVSLGAYAGNDILIRLQFQSDPGWSDEDGKYQTDGAWRIDEVAVTGYPTDDFLLGGDGWEASTPPRPEWTDMRLVSDPICNIGDCSFDFGHSWVAYDPVTGIVPVMSASDFFPNPEVGIESPDIPLPSSGSFDQILLEMSIHWNLPLEDHLFFRWGVVSDTSPCVRGSSRVFYSTSGWVCRVGLSNPYFNDLTDFIAPGATSIRLRLWLVDYRGMPNAGVPWSGTHAAGAYLDNIQIKAVGPGLSGDPVRDPCGPNTQPGTDVVIEPVDEGLGNTQATVTFTGSVLQGGTTTLASSSTGPPPPSGFRLGQPPTYFEISTNAVFEGPVKVCVDYSGLSFGTESRLRLLHQPGGQGPWVDATSSLDTENDIICAEVSSFSPFVIVEPSTIEVSGSVVSECQGPLAGITVDLDLDPTNPTGEMFTTTTGPDGSFLFTDIPVGDAPGEISMVSPLGFSPVSPVNGHTAVSLDDNQVVGFTLTCPPVTGDARGMGYWKHQANVYLKNKGSAQESQADMEVNFPVAIFNHFHENVLNSIDVDGVTYMDAGSPRPLDLAEIQTTLTVNGGANRYDRARQHYLVLLFNLASGKLHTHRVVSADGATASQAVQHIADLIKGSDAAGHDAARDIAEMINEGVEVPAGLIPLDIDFIAYARPGDGMTERLFLAQNRPNPFASRTVIRFGLPDPTAYALTIFSVSGQVVIPTIPVSRSEGRWSPVPIDGGQRIREMGPPGGA